MSHLYSREEAGLGQPRRVSHSVRPEGITAHWWGPSPLGGDRSHDRCAGIWRGGYRYHTQSRGWSDIAYSSGVCYHGHRFEGRGAGVRTAANGTNAGNSRSLAVVYIAGVGDPLTEAAKAAFHLEAQRLGQPLKWAHRDWKSTGCPGDELAAWIHAGSPASGAVLDTPPSVDLKDVDFAALRRLVAAALLNSIPHQPQLRQKDKGIHVAFLQKVLNHAAGRKLKVDGSFGPSTHQAVREVQRFTGIQADGIVGPQTWTVLAFSLEKIRRGDQ